MQPFVNKEFHISCLNLIYRISLSNNKKQKWNLFKVQTLSAFTCTLKPQYCLIPQWTSLSNCHVNYIIQSQKLEIRSAHPLICMFAGWSVLLFNLICSWVKQKREEKKQLTKWVTARALGSNIFWVKLCLWKWWRWNLQNMLNRKLKASSIFPDQVLFYWW